MISKIVLQKLLNEVNYKYLNKIIMKVEYTEGIAGDGAAILKNGVQMTVTEILQTLNSLQKVSNKWDKLDKKIGKFYEDEDSEGDLGDIGEAAAYAFGYLV